MNLFISSLLTLCSFYSHPPVLKATNSDFQEFQKIANFTGLLLGINNAVDLDDEQAYKLAKKALFKIKETINSGQDAIYSFVDYLELIASCAKGFTYKFAEDNSGKKKKLVYVIKQLTLYCL